MKVSIQELRNLVYEAVREQINEASLQEGPKEIQIRNVMMDLKDVVVGSITEDVVRETGIEEPQVASVVARAYDKMVQDIVMSLDVSTAPAAMGPRRRVVAVGG